MNLKWGFFVCGELIIKDDFSCCCIQMYIFPIGFPLKKVLKFECTV